MAEFESITQFAKRVGRTRMTVWNWIHKGVTSGSARVKLSATRIGRCWAVSQDQYAAFLAACNPGQPALPESPIKARERAKRERATLLESLN